MLMVQQLQGMVLFMINYIYVKTTPKYHRAICKMQNNDDKY